MKYFIDTEFIECVKHRKFMGMPIGKPVPTIDLISIGVVCEDGREYYAVSSEFEVKYADKWVRNNVLKPMWEDGTSDYAVIHDDPKTNDRIQKDLRSFIYAPAVNDYPLDRSDFAITSWLKNNSIEFYGYYCDYDWVVFCQLFGRMIDLPEGFPMYCRDLKQMLDEWMESLAPNDFFEYFHKEDVTFQEKINVIKNREDYPQQANEHNALADAQWNKELYDFLITQLEKTEKY